MECLICSVLQSKIKTTKTLRGKILICLPLWTKEDMTLFADMTHHNKMSAVLDFLLNSLNGLRWELIDLNYIQCKNAVPWTSWEMDKTQDVSNGSVCKCKSIRQSHDFLLPSVFQCRSCCFSGVSAGALLTWPCHAAVGTAVTTPQWSCRSFQIDCR